MIALGKNAFTAAHLTELSNRESIGPSEEYEGPDVFHLETVVRWKENHQLWCRLENWVEFSNNFISTIVRRILDLSWNIGRMCCLFVNSSSRMILILLRMLQWEFGSRDGSNYSGPIEWYFGWEIERLPYSRNMSHWVILSANKRSQDQVETMDISLSVLTHSFYFTLCLS